ncbi:MAG: glycosyltransferase [Candidatus Auribacterota bacterium]|jgi:glycosyltransferase involved in cell wall biosynthesis|nr:glycosyltransferase [Candidatus Auribacterota bacterium]
MKRNILLVTDIFPRWKDDSHIPGYVAELAKSLSAYYNIYVVVPHSHCAALFERLDTVTVIRNRYFYLLKWQLLSNGNDFLETARTNFLAFLQIPFYVISEFISIIKIIRKYNIDLLNSHGFTPHAVLCAIIKIFFKKPHIMTLHGPGISVVAQWGWFGRLLTGFALKNSDVVLPVSIYTRYLMEKISGRTFKYEIVPMGVDTDSFKYIGNKINLRRIHDIPAKHKVILFVGALIERHGIQVLLESVMSLKNDYRDFIVLIIGGGHLEEPCKKWVKEKGLFDHIIFLGWIDHDQVPAYYGISDIVVVPLTEDAVGETDGLPVVILESFAAGVPVIASQISGISDVIRHGYNGWLFEHDNKGDLYSRLDLFFNCDTQTVERMKQNARKTSEEYSWPSIAGKYVSYIRECIPIHK